MTVYSEGAMFTGSSTETEPVPSEPVVTAFFLRILSKSAVCQHCLFFSRLLTYLRHGRFLIFSSVKQSLMSTVSLAGKPV